MNTPKGGDQSNNRRMWKLTFDRDLVAGPVVVCVVECLTRNAPPEAKLLGRLGAISGRKPLKELRTIGRVFLEDDGFLYRAVM
jgi:hypothetical protein